MIFFRADSNLQIASGHIMRCVSIAKKFISNGLNVTFLIADENPIAMLEESGIFYENLHSQWDDLSKEIETVRNLLIDNPHSILFVDTYCVNKSYVESLLPYARICYLGSKKEYLGKLDCLINYSTDIDYDFYRDNYDSDTLLLLGPKYAPLRNEFQCVPICNNRDVNNCNILLTTGNTDQRNYVFHIMEALTNSSLFNKMIIRVVIGRMFENVAEIKKTFGNYSNIILLENVTSMSSLMKLSDLAITANGTTIYELAASHVPIISFAMVKEQSNSAQAFFDLGIVEYVGDMFDTEEECICNIINKAEEYILKPNKRIELAQKAFKVIDGKGCDKIVNTIKTRIIDE